MLQDYLNGGGLWGWMARGMARWMARGWLVDGSRAHARDQGSFLPLTVAIARPKARPRRGERAIATVRGRKSSGLLGEAGVLAGLRLDECAKGAQSRSAWLNMTACATVHHAAKSRGHSAARPRRTCGSSSGLANRVPGVRPPVLDSRGPELRFELVTESVGSPLHHARLASGWLSPWPDGIGYP